MDSYWGYAEHHDMEQLGQKLLYTTLVLEKLKTEAMEEMKKNKEHIKQLIDLLKLAIHERDEARTQLQKLLLLNSTTNTLSSKPTQKHFLHHFQESYDDFSIPKPAKAANSSITESHSLSETVVSSPELISNINVVENCVNLAPPRVIDKGSLVIEGIARGKELPQKGKLLQAVIEAGPLLQTLLLAGPLPRWRNPPQLQPFQIPPVVAIDGCDNSGGFARKTASNHVNNNVSPSYYGPNNMSSSQVVSSFGNAVSSGVCLNNVTPAFGNYNGCSVRLGKRQRFC